MDTVEENKNRRFLFMKLAYDKTKGGQQLDTPLNMLDLGSELGFTQDQTQSVFEYLLAAKLLESRASGYFRIKHKGIVEIESALSKPDKPTDHFPPVLNIMHFHGPVSHAGFQQGTHGSTQTVSFTHTQETLVDMQEFLKRLKNELPQLNKLSEQDRSQVVAEVATIEAQLAAPSPNGDIIKAAGLVLHGILLSVGGNLATDLLKYLTGFLHVTL